MDHQWRPVPPPHSQPNICPVCSASHYPFCNPYPHAPPPPPPPHHYPPYYQNPGFPPQQYYPWPDPYHGAAPAPYMPTPPGLWERNPNPDYGEGFRPPMQHSDYGSGNNYANGGNGYVSELDRSSKRPRVDPIGSTEFKGDTNPNSAMFSFDDERRLKLIRDHGGVSGHDKNTDFDDANGGRIAGPPNGDAVGRYSPFQPNVHHDPGSRNGDVNLGHNRYPNSNVITGHSNMNWQNHLPQSINGMADHRGNGVSNGYGAPILNEQRVYPPHHERFAPPLPASPPPPLPNERFNGSSPPATLFPIPISSPATSIYGHSKPLPRDSAAYASECHGDHQAFARKELSPPGPMIVDASHLFKQPYRANRPDHIVIILRGLPGSGKSYSAKMMRDMEVEGGGDAPRIHSMDDYFMTEVERVEESNVSKSSNSTRHKKQIVKTVVEYCYEPEMEEVYRESMLKAFKKTLEEGSFRLVIVDDRNLRVADFAQFWAIAKRSGYEVYISEAAYKDPGGCAARNVHGFTLDDIQKMAGQWEEAPSMYMKLDVKSLFNGDDLKENGIQEFDMDTEDTEENQSSQLQVGLPEKTVVPSVGEGIAHASVSAIDVKPRDGEEDQMVGVKELGKSKWSEDFDEDDRKGHGDLKGKSANALSGLIQAYGKKGKSVHWNDQMANTGFSIGAVKKANMHSLVIGPGAGYNLKSNRLPEDESLTTITGQSSSRKTRRQSGFQERLRAEQESFKAVFDRRKQRIGVLDFDEE
ncbi:unnamed protein product [Linum trigynum]|uniref:YLP motif-containing protein 1 n=1 Tax=Linum trigynum TaxID=586398 RepID=A0AAV2D5U4_9ROSI